MKPLSEISRGQSFVHAQKTDCDRFCSATDRRPCGDSNNSVMRPLRLLSDCQFKWSRSDRIAIALSLWPGFKTDNWGLKGLTKILLKSPQGLWSVGEPNRSQAVFWACTKDYPRLIWALRDFIGLLEVTKRSYFHRRLVFDSSTIFFI